MGRKTSWQEKILANLIPAISDDGFRSRIARIAEGEGSNAIHLAIFSEPFLKYILDGLKTVESRFSVNRCAPYGRVNAGDIILLKRAGGPIVAVCEVGSAWFYELEPKSLHTIRGQFSEALCAQDASFWNDRAGASYATLMTIQQVQKIDPMYCEKRDRRGWVTFQAEIDGKSLFESK